MARTPPPKLPEAHPTKWSVIIDRGERDGIRRYDTQAEAYAVCAALVEAGTLAFVQPPLAAWGGKDQPAR
jgi:hypothetical protein